MLLLISLCVFVFKKSKIASFLLFLPHHPTLQSYEKKLELTNRKW